MIGVQRFIPLLYFHVCVRHFVTKSMGFLSKKYKDLVPKHPAKESDECVGFSSVMMTA